MSRARARLLALTALVFSRASVRGFCAFTQTCATGDPGCHPVASPHPPAPATGPFPLACPQYTASTCCTAAQDKALQTNFALIYTGFELLGGNAACVANIEAFWCAYTCAPDQARFIAVRGLENMTDPINGGIVTVLHTAMTIDSVFACGIFESCRLTFTSELASFTTCEQVRSSARWRRRRETRPRWRARLYPRPPFPFAVSRLPSRAGRQGGRLHRLCVHGARHCRCGERLFHAAVRLLLVPGVAGHARRNGQRDGAVRLLRRLLRRAAVLHGRGAGGRRRGGRRRRVGGVADQF